MIALEIETRRRRLSELFLYYPDYCVVCTERLDKEKPLTINDMEGEKEVQGFIAKLICKECYAYYVCYLANGAGVSTYPDNFIHFLEELLMFLIILNFKLGAK